MATDRPVGIVCFETEISAFQKKLEEVSAKKNKAQLLYANGVRNNLFRLEALSRIYRKISDKNLFDECRKNFKSLEDALGVIDYYDGLYKILKTKKGIPSAFASSVLQKKNDAIKKCNDDLKLLDKSEHPLQISHSKILAFAFDDQENERKQIAKFLIHEIEDLVEDYNEGKIQFNNIEEGIHEMRRKLRWISIYAQSLCGLIQLKKTTEAEESLKLYLDKVTIESPFNKMPLNMFKVSPLFFQSQHFYALSWMINELGKLKDEGLLLIETNHFLKETGLNISGKNQIREIILTKKVSEDQICNRAESLFDYFMHNASVPIKLMRELKRSL